MGRSHRLPINGVELTASADEAWTFLTRLYDRSELTFDALDAWLRDNTKPT